tara:strand:- start:122 stop:604 length:483 start_codon:yes stop_codon:yes gene_type:complete
MKEKVEIVMLEYLHATVSQDIEAIKVGDYIIEDIDGLVFGPYKEGDIIENGRKVIATNDPELTSFACNQDYGICAEECQGICNSIKRLSLLSIKEYISNPDGEFEVEYDVLGYKKGNTRIGMRGAEGYIELNDAEDKTSLRLKLNQDNEVDITSVERSES